METENQSTLSGPQSVTLDKVLKELVLVGYPGPLLKAIDLHSVIEAGLKDKEYTSLVQFLTNEVRTLLKVDEDINCVTSLEDSTAFVLLITSFLRELDCPYESLTGGVLSERLTKYSDRLMLLDYLADQLMVARYLQDEKPEKKMEFQLPETPAGLDVRHILQTLRFPKPPANITTKQLFDKIETTIPLALKKADADLVGVGIFVGSFSNKQWDVLKEIENNLHKEFTLRREMMLMRLDVTIQSFQWSNKTKGKELSFEKVYFDKRKILTPEPDVDISDLFAARTELEICEKISSTSVRKNTKTPVNKVIIGRVPDRGGRSSEQEPPPPEMPSWTTRTPGGDFSRGRGNQNARGGRGGREDRGGGRGGREDRGGGRGGREDRGGGRGGREDRGGGRSEGRGRGGYRNEQSGYQGRNSGYDSGYSNDGDSQRQYRSNDHYEGGGGGERAAGGGGRRGGGSYDRYGGGGHSAYGNDSYNYNRRDSGGSGYSEDYQQTKRPKTYDDFQASKTTYAEQYVQESQHNQQYHRGGGRDSYQRGRGNSRSYRGGGYR